MLKRISSVSLIDRVSACDTVMLIPFRFTPQRWQQAVNPNTGIKISFLKLACAVVDQHLKCVFVRILHDTDEYASFGWELFLWSYMWLQYFSCEGSVLTSLVGGEFHRVAGRTLKAVVGRNHEHLVFRVGHQVTEEAEWLSHGAVETFGPLLFTDHQICDQTGLTPVVQLGGRRGRKGLMGKTCKGG